MVILIFSEELNYPGRINLDKINKLDQINFILILKKLNFLYIDEPNIELFKWAYMIYTIQTYTKYQYNLCYI